MFDVHSRRRFGVCPKKLPQRGISGSQSFGADAIIVSGKRCGDDDVEHLRYVAEWRIGANSLFMSFAQQSVIRVFRSAKYIESNNIGGTDVARDQKSTSNLYRYDGLYRIAQVKAPRGKISLSFYCQCHE